MKIRVQPIHGAEPQMCSLNVHNRINALGGKAVFGWLTKDKPGQPTIIKEQHCVWQSPDGELVDVTPVYTSPFIFEWREDTEFEPDDSVSFGGKKKGDGKHLARTDDRHEKRLAEWLTIADKAMNDGDLERCRYWTEKANKEMQRTRYKGMSCPMPRSLALPDVVETLTESSFAEEPMNRPKNKFI